MGRMQSEYKTRPDSAPPRSVSLKIGFAGMEDASVAALWQRVDDFVSKLRAEGVSVEVTKG